MFRLHFGQGAAGNGEQAGPGGERRGRVKGFSGQGQRGRQGRLRGCPCVFGQFHGQIALGDLLHPFWVRDASGRGQPCRARRLRGGRVEPGRFRAIYDSLINYGDRYLVLADYESYVATQKQVDTLYRQVVRWDVKAIANVAGIGYFSSDRAIGEYARNIWNVKPIEL